MESLAAGVEDVCSRVEGVKDVLEAEDLANIIVKGSDHRR